MYKTIDIPNEYLSNILLKNEQLKAANMQAEKIKAELQSTILLAHADLGVSTKDYALYTEENGVTHFVNKKEFEEFQDSKTKKNEATNATESKETTDQNTENIVN